MNIAKHFYSLPTAATGWVDSLVPLMLSMFKVLCLTSNIKEKRKKEIRARESLAIKAHIALAEYPSLIPNIHIGHIQWLVTLAKGI